MKMRGLIKWYKPKKGYGYIVGADGELYYFELINCINKNELFIMGDEVLFVPVFEGEYAKQVEKVSYEQY